MSSAITYDQAPILVEDTLPTVGDILPFFTLVDTSLQDVTLEAFHGQRKIMHIFPSIDTPTSAQGVRRFEGMAKMLTNTAIIHISADLPFALLRFCVQEKLTNALTLSTLRGRDMVKNYGVLMVTSQLAGLPARAVIVADSNDRILYVELVADLSNEPDYDRALQAALQTQAAQ